MKVLITIDTEINPSRIASPEQIARNVGRRIWGRVDGNEVGIAYQARSLREAGLTAVFFVEALCASVIDKALLREWVSVLQEHGQEVQLHVHAEWAQYLGIAPRNGTVGHNLFEYSRDDQKRLIGMALDNLMAAGARAVNAFRAGNYAANDETLGVLAELGIAWDSSYNRSYLDKTCRLAQATQHNMPFRRGSSGVLPVTNFIDGLGRARHAQLCACSAAEMREALGGAMHAGMPAFVIVSHSFELLTEDGKRASRILCGRWRALLRLLSRSRDTMPTTGFHDLDAKTLSEKSQGDNLSVSKLATLARLAGQLMTNRL